ncbi:MAG: hypothetical protein IPO07_31505 [Haliscomenobacter sp.]|nr:hypothetical protein [Haliscomenobacter sp.]MBK9492804.1 hypothetical protein [Haliscomenobacter sp.]
MHNNCVGLPDLRTKRSSLFEGGWSTFRGGIFAAKQNPNLSEADLIAVEADEDAPPLPLTLGHQAISVLCGGVSG